MFKAPMGQESVGTNPADRENNVSKRHLLVDARGVPLSIVVTAANVKVANGWRGSSQTSVPMMR
jgi:hypothetical protein